MRTGPMPGATRPTERRHERATAHPQGRSEAKKACPCAAASSPLGAAQRAPAGSVDGWRAQEIKRATDHGTGRHGRDRIRRSWTAVITIALKTQITAHKPRWKSVVCFLGMRKRIVVVIILSALVFIGARSQNFFAQRFDTQRRCPTEVWPGDRLVCKPARKCLGRAEMDGQFLAGVEETAGWCYGILIRA